MRIACWAAALLLCACTASRAKTLVVDADDVRTLWSPSGTARVEIFVRGQNAFLARLTMEPGAAVPEAGAQVHVSWSGEDLHVMAETR